MASPRSFVLHEYFENTVRKHPKACAIEWFEERSTVRSQTTYEQLYQDVVTLAGAICPFFGSESIGAIFMKRSSEKIYVSQLAILKAGGAYTCVDTAFPNDRVTYIFADAKPTVIITDKHSKERLKLCMKDMKIPIMEYEAVKAYSTCSKVFHNTFPKISENRLAYVIYTSGTTGKPKGVLIEHKSICNLVRMHESFFPEISIGWRIAQISSLAYDSSIEEIYLAFAKGGTLVVVDDETVRLGPDLSPWLQREQINVLTPPPTLLRSMGPEASASLPYLKILYVGGEEITPDLVTNWSYGRRLVNGYGPTECSVTVSVAELRADQPVTIGKVVPNNTAHILDENMMPVERGQKGELCISGLSVSRGYLNRPELTDSKFVKHTSHGRMYRTGDLVGVNGNQDLLYFGRIDSQVKLRGYRIELSSIEGYLKNYVSEIKDVVCTVVKYENAQKIVAFVILRSAECMVDIASVKSSMSDQLPHYMIPSDIITVKSFPSTTSGKLDTSTLHSMYKAKDGENDEIFDAKVTDVEQIISQAFRSNLSLGSCPASSEDFFELGGDSLTAAMAISDLRKHAKTSKLAVRDIYNQRTIGNLAKICSLKRGEREITLKNFPLQKCPISLTLLQMLWILFFLYNSSLVLGFAIVSNSVTAVYIFTLIALLWFPISVTIAVCAKWILIGKYTAGSHPVWGWFYLRHWMLRTITSLIPWKLISGTCLHNVALRALGATIGENVYIHTAAVVEDGGWDLLIIGDNVVIGRDAKAATIKFERHHMHLGTVSIKDNVHLETLSHVCCNTEIGRNSVITYSSLVSTGTVIPPSSRVTGVPGRTSPLQPSDVKRPFCRVMSPYRYAIQFVSMNVAINLLTNPFLIAFQAESYMGSVGINGSGPVVQAIIKCAFLVGGVVVSLSAQIAVLHILGRVREGTYHRRSFEFMVICIKDRIVTSAGLYISGTMFWPTWLRWAGMKVERNCEVSTIMEVIPELITIEDETFFADMIYLGGPRFVGDYAIMERIKIGKGTFLGNGVIIPPGSHLPPDILIGVCSVADDKKIYSGSSWFGNPLFELPRREVVSAERSATHNPSTLRYISRLFWELLRFTITIPPVLIVLARYDHLYQQSQVQNPTTFHYITVPVVSIASLAILPLIVLTLKWLLIGRMSAGVHPLWSCWCSRWDFIYVIWNSWAKSILNMFNGTQILNVILRLFGVSIGKNVFIHGHEKFSQITDPDLLHFEDGTTISCDFQAHTFEDRVLKKAPLYVRKGATVGGGTMLMYGSDVGQDTVVRERSVVMKNELIPANSCFVGCPTREC